MINRFISLARKVASKPFNVVWFRLRQEIRLVWLRHSGGWKRIDLAVARLPSLSMGTTVLSNQTPDLTEAQQEALKKAALRVREGKFDILGSRAPDLHTCDFSGDWRFGHRWPNQYFKSYSFYEERDTPYDVKMPWELSRMGFLIPVLAQQVVRNDVDLESVSWVHSLLVRWEDENPIAESVNWYPMEASMRAVILVLMLDLVRLMLANDKVTDKHSALADLGETIAGLIYKNSAFVWETREYTDVRGNHFAANIVALYLSGLALGAERRQFGRWHRYAKRWIETEIRNQFYSDGVNFEKSLGYHGLVLELFSLAAVAAETRGDGLSEGSLSILERAAGFSDAATRPDALCAAFGDTDDACALSFTLTPSRCHGSVIELWRAWRMKPVGSFCFEPSESIAAVFLTGRQPVRGLKKRSLEFFEYRPGGYYVARNLALGFFFMVDVGEVGMNGRGGHGHNDLLSFELFIDGQPCVLDPGVSVYTGDFAKKNWFRSTAAHATVSMFDAEMADLTGHWTISDHAHPFGVSAAHDLHDGSVVLSGCHDGFSRIQPGATVCRRFSVNARKQTLTIVDDLSVPVDDTSVQWRFPTSATIVAQIDNDPTVSQIGPARLTSEVRLEATRTLHSEGYGQEINVEALTGQTRLAKGAHKFTFRFTPIQEDEHT